MKPRSIKIFLSQGDPSGIRTAQMSMSTILAIAFRRNQLNEVRKKFPEILNPGVYILIGSDSEPLQAYIGESEQVATRLAKHSADSKEGGSKEYWVDTVVLNSKDENLTKSHVRYVESKLLDVGCDNSRWVFPNNAKPSSNAGKLPVDAQAEMDKFIEQAKILVGILGWDVFRDLRHRSSSAIEEKSDSDTSAEGRPLVFSCKGSTYDAKMIVVPSGECFVLKGSKARAKLAKSAREALRSQQEALLNSKVLVDEGGFLLFTSDYGFKSPSAAASVVSGANVNGRTSWVLPDGQTYADWETKQLAEPDED